MNITDRLKECTARIGSMCGDGRPPRMSVPVREDDDDIFITTTCLRADKIIDELRTENEQLRVQLAGCGVAALGNTEASKLQCAKPGDYGYSESYAEVCRAVDREIEQRKVLEQAQVAIRLRDEPQGVGRGLCKLALAAIQGVLK